MIAPARTVAFDILMRVEKGAWASELLRSAKLDARDAALASELVYGVLRYQSQLDAVIGKPKLDTEVRIALRLGVYQILHLDRIPKHAAVSESVELVKRARKRSAAGLVNALLRKVTPGPRNWPDEPVAHSLPEWLWQRWVAQYGKEKAETIGAASLRPPETFVRSDAPAEGLEPTEVPGCYRVLSGRHNLRQQDIGSQWVVTLLDLVPGQRFLDVCAAPGNKTATALEAGVRAIACDLHLHRLRTLVADCPRVALDATQPLPFRQKFERILVDAPCSGTGTLARNPEIKWRLKPSDIVDLQRRQIAILRSALAVLAPGGRLVYSTCSLEREENQEVVEAVAGKVETWQRLPGIHAGDGFFAAVIPSS
jgi:16S rRNA (cytosine967-C5)-methyltransferase